MQEHNLVHGRAFPVVAPGSGTVFLTMSDNHIQYSLSKFTKISPVYRAYRMVPCAMTVGIWFIYKC